MVKRPMWATVSLVEQFWRGIGPLLASSRMRSSKGTTIRIDWESGESAEAMTFVAVENAVGADEYSFDASSTVASTDHRWSRVRADRLATAMTSKDVSRLAHQPRETVVQPVFVRWAKSSAHRVC